MRTINVAPRASILIESLRDFGYSLETALADIIDNSITAQAKTIKLYADIGDSETKIGILDDGEGMTEKDLLMAMRLGSRNPLEDRPYSDLGRFGLGLKTASFSQCRRFTVVTRRDNSTSAAVWDIDDVSKKDNWLVQIPDDPSSIPWFENLGKRGTLVVWEKLDRLIEKASSDYGRSYIIRRIDDTREHLELVFHRFLSGERGLQKISILLNERPLEPFDPFHSSHPATITGPIERIRVGGQEVIIQTFTLPHHRKVSPVEWERYAGRAGYLKNQGFYVYREKRLIIYGTWFNLARQMELTKLARVRIDIKNGMDAQWKIDVKKSSAQLPFKVRERLRRLIETIGANSKRIYTVRGRKLTTDSRLPFWNRVQDKNEIIYRINTEHPVIMDFVSRLHEGMKGDFSRLMELTGSTLPMDSLFADLGGAPEKVTGNTLSEETLHYTLITTVKRLQESGVHHEDISDMLELAEPFRSNWQLTKEMLDRIVLQEVSIDRESE